MKQRKFSLALVIISLVLLWAPMSVFANDFNMANYMPPNTYTASAVGPSMPQAQGALPMGAGNEVYADQYSPFYYIISTTSLPISSYWYYPGYAWAYPSYYAYYPEYQYPEAGIVSSLYYPVSYWGYPYSCAYSLNPYACYDYYGNYEYYNYYGYYNDGYFPLVYGRDVSLLYTLY